ncbi:aa3-type cytochrome oxidase subunit II [Sediminivirga luteola]|uniref:cytochrome-c oxidase n=1 Tax=Sediminivirga luteola TaxID=1774748 RepID=A0A8J2XLJ7_9MICO|nr:cytochrome c oxidase subunit II [Sediminivirga luteola]
MRSQNEPASRVRRRWTRGAGLAGLTASALLLAGCTREQIEVGFLPPQSKGVTDNADVIIGLWNGSWIAALIVGFITWSLILWCLVAYRRRKGETSLPVQLRYNLPVEIFYTAVPLLLVVAFFFHTVQAQAEVDEPNSSEKVIEVVGKQWSWDFNYLSDDVYYAGVQANLDGTEQPGVDAPTLYLPVDTEIEIVLRSRDVVHSFWVPAFLQKRDTIPGVENRIFLTTQQEGEYLGKCAELCGEFHSEMLFNVRVVSMAEYDEYIESLREQGNTGRLGPEYDRDPYAEIGGNE